MDGTAPGDILSTMINTPEKLSRDLVAEALKYKGIHEVGGNNKGPDVEMFQKAVDGKASREAWCLAFVQYCIKQIEEKYSVRSLIYKTEHCLTCWRESPDNIKLKSPVIGSIVLWRHANTSNGHAGIVTGVRNGAEWIETIEANTSPDAGIGVVREGDGIYTKLRKVTGSGDMNILGYLRPFV